MPKRNSLEIRKKILQYLKENPLTLAQLERKVNTNSRTIKQDCEELKFYKLITIEKGIHPANGKLFYTAKLTNFGIEIIG